MTRATLAVLLPTALSGCVGRADAPSGAGWAGETRDSAGVVLVANHGTHAWDEGEAWRATEDLVVRAEPSRPETLFGYVSDVAVDARGRMYVLDQQAQAVRAFGPDGESLHTIGRPGEGPGELGRFTFSVLVRADTLLVVDWGQGRLSRFHTDGPFLTTERVPTAGAARSWWASTSDGLLFRSLARYTDEEDRWRGRDALLRYRGAGMADTVLVFAYPQSDLGAPGAPNVPLIVNAPSWAALPNGGVAWLALHEPVVRVHSAGGSLERVISSAAWTARPPTVAEVRVMSEKLGDKLEMLGGSRESLAQLRVQAPERLPAITSVAAGPHGTLWVQRAGPVDDIHPMALNGPDPPSGFGGSTWDVLDEEGRYLGPLELPRGFRLFRITDTHVYGVRRDALDVEELVRLRLEIP